MRGVHRPNRHGGPGHHSALLVGYGRELRSGCGSFEGGSVDVASAGSVLLQQEGQGLSISCSYTGPDADLQTSTDRVAPYRAR
jgi:hypothetical protein